MGGNLKADIPSPEEMAPMFEDAAYWNRYNQYTPWGNVVWNDDRTSMYQELPPYMWDMLGSQMGLRQAALGELLSWFGGSPIDFSGMYGGGGGGAPPYAQGPFDGGPYNQEEEGPLDESLKSYISSYTDWGPKSWQDAFSTWGMPTYENEQMMNNWWGQSGGLVPDWFANTRHGADPSAYAAWYAVNRLGVDPSLLGIDKQMWTSEDLPDNWVKIISEALGTGQPTGGLDDAGGGGGRDEVAKPVPEWPYNFAGGNWGTGMTGGPWGGYGGREPEMFYATDIPSLLWNINWDEVPDLPTLDQFSADRERITNEMYSQGLSLLDPYLQEQEARRRQSLSDRGIPISAEIGMAEMGDWGRERSKALSDLSFSSLMGGYDEAARQFGLGLQSYGAGLQGELARLGMANQARGQAWNERMGVRGQKFNELASILGLAGFGTQQQGYNFNPGIDTMGGYGLGTQNSQFNSGLFNSWLMDIFNSIQFM